MIFLSVYPVIFFTGLDGGMRSPKHPLWVKKNLKTNQKVVRYTVQGGRKKTRPVRTAFFVMETIQAVKSRYSTSLYVSAFLQRYR